MIFGSNAYLNTFRDSATQYNDQNVYFPGASSPLNSGENILFDHMTFGNGNTIAGCVQIGDGGFDGPQVTFNSPSFDDCQLVNKNSMVTVLGGHFEMFSAGSNPYVVTTSDNYTGLDGMFQTTLIGTQLFGNGPITPPGFFEVDRYGSLNIIGLSDRTGSGIPLAYLNTAAGGSPQFSIYAPDNPRTPAQLYALAAGTRATVTAHTRLTNHGKGLFVQRSDGTGVAGDVPMFNGTGDLVDSGILVGTIATLPTKTGTSPVGSATCWATTGMIGHCSTAVSATGTCTCN